MTAGAREGEAARDRQIGRQTERRGTKGLTRVSDRGGDGQAGKQSREGLTQSVTEGGRWEVGGGSGVAAGDRQAGREAE